MQVGQVIGHSASLVAEVDSPPFKYFTAKLAACLGVSNPAFNNILIASIMDIIKPSVARQTPQS